MLFFIGLIPYLTAPWIALLVVQALISAILLYGGIFAYFQDRWPTLARRGYAEDRRLALTFACSAFLFYGVVGLITFGCFGYFAYGLKFR